MKKPEKRCNPEGLDRPIDYGYNYCYDEFMKFLPDEKEIAKIAQKTRYDKHWFCSECIINTAKVLAKRIGKESICDTALYPKCNGADGCQNYEERG